MQLNLETSLESDLAAALDSLPTRRSGPENIGQRLGLSAQAIGTHTQQTRHRTFVDGRGQVAAELIKRLPRPGEAIHFLMDGTFTLANCIPVIQSQIGEPCELTVATLGLNDATTDTLAAMLRAGTLAGLRLAISAYFRATDPETADRAVRVLKEHGAQVAVERMHAKLQLWQPATKPARYVLETSSNLRSCNCIEAVALTNDAALYRWHNRWLTEFFERNAIQ